VYVLSSTKSQNLDFVIDILQEVSNNANMQTETQTPQFATPPGEVLRKELEVRGWSQYDLADILGVNQSLVSAVITGKRPITLELARDLASAFGTEPAYWINLETSFRLFTANPDDGSIARRAKLFQAAPVNEMIKRRWIQHTSDVSLLEKQVLGFYGVTSLEEIVAPLAHAARKHGSYAELKPAERAWIHKVRKTALAVSANKFTDSAFKQVISELKALLTHPESVRHVPKLLAKAGIRFVVVEPLGRSRIDGICLWLDKQSPVIGVSLRVDRVDSFWFTLFHECGHIDTRDGLLRPAADSDLIGENAIPSADKPECERKADHFATSALIKPTEMNNFIARVSPLFSKTRIQGFATRIGVHPAIVLGQLHHKGQVAWGQHSRDFTVKVRDLITQAALTDGWGQTLPAAS